MLNKLFRRHSFKIILVVLFLLPVLSRGAQGPAEQRQRRPRLAADHLRRDDRFCLVPAALRQRNLRADQLGRLHARRPAAGAVRQEDRAPGSGAPASMPGHSRSRLPPSGTATCSSPSGSPSPIPWPTLRGPLFKSVETGPRLMTRLTEPPISLTEDQAIKRLNGLFVGPDDKQSCAVVTLTPEGKRDLRVTLAKLHTRDDRRAGPAARAGADGRPAGRQRGDQRRRRKDADSAVHSGRHRGLEPGLLVPAQRAADDHGVQRRALCRRDQPGDRLLLGRHR